MKQSNDDNRDMSAAEIEAMLSSANSGEAIEEPFTEAPEAEPPSPSSAVPNPAPAARAQAGDEAAGLPESIHGLLDIELPISVSFGGTRQSLRRLLTLSPGVVLDLDRDAEAPVVVKINNKTFARGELVNLDGYYGVEITEIVSTVERIQSLGEA